MPLRAAHVMSVIQQMRGGEDNDSRFGVRMKGEGIFAELIAQRFEKACARLGLNQRHYDLDVSLFRVPERVLPKPRKARLAEEGPQLALF